MAPFLNTQIPCKGYRFQVFPCPRTLPKMTSTSSAFMLKGYLTRGDRGAGPEHYERKYLSPQREEKKAYHDNPKDADEEYYVELKNFIICESPLTPSEIVDITGINYRFMKTCFAIRKDSGAKVWKEISRRENL